MTQFDIIDLFKSLGFKCLEDNICQEVGDFGYYSRFGNSKDEIFFQNRDGKLQVIISGFESGLLVKVPLFKVSNKLALAISEQIKVILEEYKGEIE
jgi:hypothetical protein